MQSSVLSWPAQMAWTWETFYGLRDQTSSVLAAWTDPGARSRDLLTSVADASCGLLITVDQSEMSPVSSLEADLSPCDERPAGGQGCVSPGEISRGAFRGSRRLPWQPRAISAR